MHTALWICGFFIASAAMCLVVGKAIRYGTGE